MAWQDWGIGLGSAFQGFMGTQQFKEGKRRSKAEEALAEDRMDIDQQRATAYINMLNQQRQRNAFDLLQDQQAAEFLAQPSGMAYADPSQIPARFAPSALQYQSGQQGVDQGQQQLDLGNLQIAAGERAAAPADPAVLEFLGLPAEAGLTQGGIDPFIPGAMQNRALQTRAALGGGDGGPDAAMRNSMLRLHEHSNVEAMKSVVSQGIEAGDPGITAAVQAATDPLSGALDWGSLILPPEAQRNVMDIAEQYRQVFHMTRGMTPPGYQQAPPEMAPPQQAELAPAPQAQPQAQQQQAQQQGEPLPTSEQLLDLYMRQHPGLQNPAMQALAGDEAALLSLARQEWETKGREPGAGFAFLGKEAVGRGEEPAWSQEFAKESRLEKTRKRLSKEKTEKLKKKATKGAKESRKKGLPGRMQ